VGYMQVSQYGGGVGPGQANLQRAFSTQDGHYMGYMQVPQYNNISRGIIPPAQVALGSQGYIGGVPMSGLMPPNTPPVLLVPMPGMSPVRSPEEADKQLEHGNNCTPISTFQPANKPPGVENVVPSQERGALSSVHSYTDTKPLPFPPNVDYKIQERLPDGTGLDPIEVRRVDIPKASDIKAPDIKEPDTKEPDIKAPDIKAPPIKTPDTKAPDIKALDTKAPDIKAPDTKVPDTPDIKAPDIKAPDTKVPDTPDTKAPDIKAPDTKVPDTPDIKAPDTKAPDIKAPDIRAPDITALDTFKEVAPCSPYPDKVPVTVVNEIPTPKTNSVAAIELFSACKERKIDEIKRLLEKPDIDITTINPQGYSVLHIALGTAKVNADQAKMQNIATTVRLLCARGANVNAQDKFGLSPLHYCAQTINLDAARCLLEREADPSLSDSRGRTALNLTAQDSQPDVKFTEFLISKGAKLGKAKVAKLPPRANQSQKMVRVLLARVA